MIRFLLLAVLFILVARAFWRIMDAVLEASRGTTSRRHRRVPAVKLVRDPVCGTHIPPRPDLSLTAAGTTHYFCSERCLKTYRGRG